MTLRPGLYDSLIDAELEQKLESVAEELQQLERLDPADSAAHFARHLLPIIVSALQAATKGQSNPAAKLSAQRQLTNQLLETAREALGETSPNLLAETERRLVAVAAGSSPSGEALFPRRPEVSVAQSALLVNGRDQPRIGSEVERELDSADRVDLLCAFIKWTGLRTLIDAIRKARERCVPVRVLTTTYVGSTDRRALDALRDLGAEIQVSYETGRTRLHAKAWLFHRDSGFSTAYVGSSNMSHQALSDGLEWNVRLTHAEQPHLLETFRSTFEEYWRDDSFEAYDSEAAAERFERAIQAERAGTSFGPTNLSGLEVTPWRHQERMLDELQAEREIHGRYRNLVVAATGTGKTILAALDYERLKRAGTVESLLFVAHRKEILTQSAQAFREVLRMGDFGEQYVDGRRPEKWQHVFASVQSLQQLELAEPGGDGLQSDHFDMVIVDEFHHAEAPTYTRLLEHLEPKVLLGLTATPERADGQDVKRWFGGRFAVEMRLWEALDEGLLCPFHYFGIHDNTRLEGIEWRAGRYDAAALTNLYTSDDARARLVAEEVQKKITDPGAMRALGFCVSVAHAEFMARKFREFGLSARAVSGQTPRAERDASLAALRSGGVQVLFTVDLFNEGVDVPEIDTVLFLRPTESATVFLQQLGRGLRKAPDKPCLTCLDFVGHQHGSFRFDQKYRGMLRYSRRELEREVEDGFPHLPAGCHMELDSVAREIVLRNVQSALRLQCPGLVKELRQLGPETTLEQFIQETQLEAEDVYRKKDWTALRRESGFEKSPSEESAKVDRRLGKGLARLLHIDDAERLAFLERVLTNRDGLTPVNEREQRLLTMLHYCLWGPDADPQDAADRLREALELPGRRSEMQELAALLQERRHRLQKPLREVLPRYAHVPLQVHATYRRDEIVAAFGDSNPGALRQGVKWVEAEQADFFLVTLKKTEEHFSPTTRYEDRAVSRTLFHWESQHTTSEASPTGQRYLHHAKRGSSVHLFVREQKSGVLGAEPFFYAGPATYVEHESEKPLRILWELAVPLPAEVFQGMRLAAS
ncbi:MAG: DUF3427 domain-containing protein [Acidobacteriota bacterium]